MVTLLGVSTPEQCWWWWNYQESSGARELSHSKPIFQLEILKWDGISTVFQLGVLCELSWGGRQTSEFYWISRAECEITEWNKKTNTATIWMAMECTAAVSTGVVAAVRREKLLVSVICLSVHVMEAAHSDCSGTKKAQNDKLKFEQHESSAGRAIRAFFSHFVNTLPARIAWGAVWEL